MGTRSHHYSKFSTARGMTQNSQRETRNKGGAFDGQSGNSGYNTQANSPNLIQDGINNNQTRTERDNQYASATIDYNTTVDLMQVKPMPL